MIRIQTNLIWRGCAQGKYVVKAKGYILAVLRCNRTMCDKICFTDEIKSVLSSDEVGFHHEVISTCPSGVYLFHKDEFS